MRVRRRFIVLLYALCAVFALMIVCFLYEQKQHGISAPEPIVATRQFEMECDSQCEAEGAVRAAWQWMGADHAGYYYIGDGKYAVFAKIEVRREK